MPANFSRFTVFFLDTLFFTQPENVPCGLVHHYAKSVPGLVREFDRLNRLVMLPKMVLVAFKEIHLPTTDTIQPLKNIPY